MTGPRFDAGGTSTGAAAPTIEELDPTGWPTAAPAPVPASRGRVGLRWAVALVVVALVVAASAAGAWFLAGQSTVSTLAAWAPAGSVLYSEVRLDLPGDQRQQLGDVLAHFPGFKDQSILDDKIAEAFDQALEHATNGARNYSTEIKPWFGGELALALGPLPPVAASDSPSMRNVRFLALATTKDRAATEAWIGKLVASAGGTPPTTSTYKGASLWTTAAGSASGSTDSGDERATIAVTDRVLLVGDDASVRASIDANGSGGLASDPQFGAAMDRLGGDHLVATYVAARAYVDWMMQAARAAGASTAVDASVAELVPAWIAGDLRATNGDAVTGRAVAPHTAKVPIVGAGQSVLPAHIPAGALAVLDAHDYGRQLLAALDAWRATPSIASAVPSVDQALTFLGGPDTALGWIGETAAVVAHDGDGISAGLLVAPTSADKAQAFGRQVRNLLALAGGAAGVTTRDEDHAGTTITIVDGGDLATLLGHASGGAASNALPVSGRLEIAFAVRDDLVAIGAPAFVRSALDTNGSNSLAADPRFSAALGRVGAANSGVGWVDLAAVRQAIEALVPAGSEQDRYRQDVQPYLAPLDMLAFAGSTASDVDSATFTLITR